MNVVAALIRAGGGAVAIAASRSIVSRARRPKRTWSDHELSRLDADFQTTLRTHLETARRHDRRFTLTSTELAAHDGDTDRAAVAIACEQHIRVLDAVTVTDGALLMLWGSTEQTEVAAVLERLIAAEVLPASSLALTGAATFPTDGLTAVSLTEAAADRVGAFAAPHERPTLVLVGATAAHGDAATAASR